MRFSDRALSVLKAFDSKDVLLTWKEHYSSIEFEASEYDMLRAELELNRALQFSRYATLNDFFDYIPFFDYRVVSMVDEYPSIFNNGWCITCFDVRKCESIWVEVQVDVIIEGNIPKFEYSYDIPPCSVCGEKCTVCVYCEMESMLAKGEYY